MEPSLLCVNCAAPPPPHRRTWGRCVLCVELNLPSTYYCGEECMKAHWPKHKVWHKEQKEKEERIREGTALDHDRSLAEAEAQRAERTGDEYAKRCATTLALMAEGDLNAAAKAWRKMNKQWPDHPGPYYNLGLVLERSHRFVQAAEMYLKSMELYEEGTEKWADAASGAFNVLKHPDCKEVPKPEWWNDEGLKALSARVVALAPRCAESCSMRARVLSGEAWDAGPRTAAEIKQAATWYRRAAETTSIPARKLCCEKFARQCDALADPLLAMEKAVAEEARVAAAAEAAEALKVAEAKASAAAEELLAEAEKEKQQASHHKAKGKGKKGKGKR